MIYGDRTWMVECVDIMTVECVIIMCVISEYAEYGYACFSESWQVGETKNSAGRETMLV